MIGKTRSAVARVAVLAVIVATLTVTTATAENRGVQAATATPRATATLRPAAGTPMPTATRVRATAQRTATPPATLSAPVADLLESGRWHQLIGDCEWARREFAEIAAAQPASAEAAEANYRMAQCYLRDDAIIEAADTLAALLKSAPQADPHRTPAQFLYGQALATLLRWEEAEAAYSAHLKLAPELQYLTWQRIGAIRKTQNDLAGATEAFTSALAQSPDWANTLQIRRNLADLALMQDRPQDAVVQYDALRGDNATGALAAEMHYLAGNALALTAPTPAAPTATATVRPTARVTPRASATPLPTATPVPVPPAALERWRAAMAADITSRWAHAAIVALLDAGEPVDEFQRGLANYHTGVYDLAIAAFDRLRAADATGKGGLAWYYSGLSYIALGDYAAGIRELETFMERAPDLPQVADAWMAKARAQMRAGDAAGALETYRQLAEQKPDSPQAPKALWQFAIQQDPEPPVAAAAERYLDLARRYPKADEGWRAYQNAGVIYFRLGNYRAAADAWREMAGKAELPAFTRPVAYYWLGRALLAQGDRAAAEQAWQSAEQAGPESFYGLRAADWRAGREREGMDGRPTGAAQSPRVEPAPGSAAEKTQIAAWLRTWAGQGTLNLPPAVLNDGDWQRGEALLELGFRSAALTQWERVRQRNEKNGWTLAALSLAFREHGANRLSLLAAEQAVALSGKLMREAPVALQRLAYPMPYDALIRAEAVKYKIDPRLLAAIIRQESRFEAGVASVAGAQGLMQVMPGTAESIAGQLGRSDFEAHHAYYPYINVAFGAYYIDQWVTHFDDSLFTGLAAYNGGPGNAQVWRSWVSHDDDLFAAAININETRVYVQAVWSHYEAYRRLYPQ